MNTPATEPSAAVAQLIVYEKSMGNELHFSGTVPPGKYDIVPQSAPAAAVGGDRDWYTDPDSGSHIVDISTDGNRQLALILKADGTVKFAAYVDGVRTVGDAMGESFVEVVRSWSSPPAGGFVVDDPERDTLVGALLDEWEFKTGSDLAHEMREAGIGKRLDALLAHMNDPEPRT